MPRAAGVAPSPIAWLLWTAAVGGVMLAATTWPIFSNPQIEPDDYRYLSATRSLDRDFLGNLGEASVVENRWDHLWWIESPGTVRFYRPLVVLSYWLDGKIYGGRFWGLLLTNVLLCFGCVVLFSTILARWVGPGIPALAGTALFAAFNCHGEVLWYVAGRTDTLAALGFLAGLALHVTAGDRRWQRYLALPCYALAVATKESAVCLPLVVLLHDRWLDGDAPRLPALLRVRGRLYAGYGVTALAVLALRRLALGPGGSGLVYPYFVSPVSPAFPGHVWTQLRSYSENLLLARPTVPFTGAIDLPDTTTWTGLAATIFVVALVSFVLRREKLYRVLGLLGLMTWIPTSFVYVSERYLFLPSIAVAGTLALLLSRLRPHGRVFALALALSAVWIGHQGYRLERRHADLAAPRVAQIVARQIDAVAGQIPAGAKLLIVNLPGDWLQAQFVQDQLRVQLDDPTLAARILTVMPVRDAMGLGVEREPEGPDAIVLRGGRFPWVEGRAPLLEHPPAEYPWIPLDAGTVVDHEHLGFTVEILEGRGPRCEVLRFEFPDPIESYTLLQFFANGDGRLSPWDRVVTGRATVEPLR